MEGEVPDPAAQTEGRETRMRKLLATALLLAAMSSQVGAHADTVQGHIHVGTPLSEITGGVTENVDACTPGGDNEGFDGQWFEVTGGQTVTATLIDGATGVEDLDAYFYTAACGPIADTSMATTKVSETGTAPATAAFIVVNLWSGAMADFSLTRT